MLYHDIDGNTTFVSVFKKMILHIFSMNIQKDFILFI